MDAQDFGTASLQDAILRFPVLFPSSIVKALGAAVCGAVVFVASLLAVWMLGPGLVLTFFSNRGPDRTVYRGFGLVSENQSWTRAEVATVALPGLDRSVPLTLTIRASAPVPEPPTLVVRADGYTLGSQQLLRTEGEWTLQIPARGPKGVTLEFEVSQLYRPANGDLPRGALFRQISLAPVGRWWPPLRSVVDAALVGAALGGAFALVELPLVGAMLGLLLGGVVSALVGHHGVAAVTPWDVQGIRAAYYALGLSAVVAAWRRFGLPDVWRDIGQYLVVSLAMLWFNLLFWLNPETPAGDLTFHVHRLQYALSGHYFFTEGTPGGVSPYAIGLYVIAGLFQQATPFWQSGNGLHVIAALAEAVAGFLIACAVRRAWQAHATALMALLTISAVSAEFQAHAVGYMTNAFAQPMAVAALASLAVASPVIGGVCALPWTIIAFLSHTGTFITLAAILLTCVVVQALTPGRDNRRMAVVILGVLAIASTVSIALFYSHFGDVYRDLLTRSRHAVASVPLQRAEAHQTEWVPGWPALLQRLAAVPGYVHKYLGYPLLALAAAGAWSRRFSTDVWTRLLQGWVVACAALFVLGQVSSIDVRYYLAVGPALAVFASVAMVSGWASARWRWPTVILGVLVLAQALSYRFEWFSGTPR